MKWILSGWICLMMLQSVHSQTKVSTVSDLPVVHDLSYKLHSRTFHVLQQGLQAADIHPIDLVAFRNSEKKESFHLSLDAQGDPVTTRELLSHENAYPSWYQAPAVMVFGPQGIVSRMSKDADPDLDKVSPYEADEQEAYDAEKEQVKAVGYLPGLLYASPTQKDIEDLEANGMTATWSDDGKSLTLVMDARTISWDNANQVMTIRTPQEAGDGWIEVNRYYRTDEASGLPVLHVVVIEEDMFLMDGHCAKRVTVEEIQDLEYGKGEHESGLRSTVEPEPTGEVSLFPNPSDGTRLQLELSAEWVGKPVVIRIFDSTGSQLHAAEMQFDDAHATLHLAGSRYASGLYFIRLESGTQFHAQPFFITR